MLFGLKQPLSEGESVAISLQTKDGESIIISAKVAGPSVHKHH